MFRRQLLLGLLCVGVLGCDDTTVQTVVDVLIVDGDGGNPVAGLEEGTLGIGIQEGELDPQIYELAITDGAFDWPIEFQSFVSPTRLRVELTGSSETLRLLTAPPVFVPALSGLFIRVVATAPSSCEKVSFNFMVAPRSRFGMALSGSFALLAGGTSTDVQLELLDALRWAFNTASVDDLNALLEPLGDTRVATIDATQTLVLPADAAPFVFDIAEATAENQRTRVDLHTGAGPRSALVSVPGLGAMVIGGEAGGVPRDGVTLVASDAETTSLQLSEPRSGAMAAAMGTDVLVVGGNEVGNAEILREGASIGEPVTSLMDRVREGGLLVGDGASRALLVGGVDDTATLRQDTVEFTSCPDACESSTGPTWATARLEAVLPERSTLLIGGVDSRRVEQVRWSGDSVEIAPLLDLVEARAAAGAVVLESGAFIVGGGDDGAVRRDDFEFCVPSELEPL